MGKKKTKAESEPRVITIPTDGPLTLRTLHNVLHKLLQEGTDEDLPIKVAYECVDCSAAGDAILENVHLVTERPAPCDRCLRPHETQSFIRLDN